MKKMMILGAGGSPAVNFTRSLRASPEEFHLIGTDADKYYLQRAEVDERYLVPWASKEGYIDVLNDIIKQSDIGFMHVQNDTEIEVVSRERDKLNASIFFPKHKTVEICQDKMQSYEHWKKAGIVVPETMMLNDEKDLEKALEKYDGKIWIREISGAGGRGSFPATDFKQAKAWINFKQGWGKFTAAECLQPQSITWLSIWKDGELVVAQSRKRVYWEMGKLAPSGISGITGTGQTVSDQSLDDIAQKTIFAVDKEPNGIFAVDLTFDGKGIPNPTEINIARFFTTHEFFTQAGLNMPYIFTKLAFGEKIPEIKKKINPLKDDLAWIRGVDFLPILTDMKIIDAAQTELDERLKRVCKPKA
tara:strand:- start:3846 stop:4928 length:1083 start_codon:yes stop_codon:yes gene_type:complete